MFFPFFQPSSDQLVNNAKILHYFKINNKLAFASQICSGCGAYVEKDLSVRMHCCFECGLTLDKGANVACIVLKRGFELGWDKLIICRMRGKLPRWVMKPASLEVGNSPHRACEAKET